MAASARSTAGYLRELLALLLVAAGLVAFAPVTRAADAPAAPAAASCDPYKDYSCLDKSLGTGIWERLVNYYALEWNQPGPPTDPKAPPTRRDGWPTTPQTTPPMPFTEWPYGGEDLMGVTTPNSVDSPLMTAIANTAVGQWMSDHHFQTYGWINVGANISSSTVKPGGNSPAAYAYNPDEVTLDQFVWYWDRFPDTVQKDHLDWGMRLSAIYGTNYRYTTSYGMDSWQYLTRNRANGYDFPMLWLELFDPFVMEGLQLRFGRFISVPDIEAQLAPNNYMYSHSMTYAFDNYTNTGLIASLAVTPRFFLQVGVTDGTEASLPHIHETVGNPTRFVTLPGYGTIQNPLFPDASFKKDPGAQPSYSFCARYQTQTGDDDLNLCADGINRGTWGYNNMQWYGGTYYHKFNDKWHLSYEAYTVFIRDVPNLNNPVVQALNAKYGADGGTPFSSLQGILFNNPDEAWCLGNETSVGGPLKCTSHDTATVAYLNYSPDPLNNFSIRPEFFEDGQGQRTGTPTRYFNFGLGWQHWYGPQLEVRPEVVWYHAFNAPAFNGNVDALPTAIAPDKKSEVILSGDLIWHF
jgi:hypothetical protein